MGMAKSVMDQIQDRDVSDMDRGVVMRPAGEGRWCGERSGFPVLVIDDYIASVAMRAVRGDGIRYERMRGC